MPGTNALRQQATSNVNLPPQHHAFVRMIYDEFVFKLTGGRGHCRWCPVRAYRRRRDRQSQVPWLSPQIVSVQLSTLPSRILGIQAIHAVPNEPHHVIHAHDSQPVLATQ